MVLLLGLVVVVSCWWVIGNDSHARPSEGVVDVWVTWGDSPEELQALLGRYSQSGGLPVNVRTRIRSDDLLGALDGSESPDLVILSSADLVASYRQQELVEPLDGWIQASNLDLDDFYAAPLAQCQAPDGATLCLPWGCDVDVLLWNKDLFRSAGLDPERPPQTMEELVEVAGKLTVRDEEGELSQVGFIPDFPRSHADLYIRMFGGAFYSDEGTRLTVNSEPVLDAMIWQRQFYEIYAPEELKDFVSSFTPYATSSHPLYAARRLSCQQCHRSSPIQNGKTPDVGFFEGKVAMMVDGEWQASANALSGDGFPVDFGVAPFPPPAAHPETANGAVVRGPVLVVPAGAIDKEAGLQLLTWMISPEIVAEAAHAHSFLPASRTAARDPRFQQMPNLEVFAGLLTRPGTGPAFTTPIRSKLNEVLGQVEAEVLRSGGDPVLLLDDAQAGLAVELDESLAGNHRP
jgi:multiple sugar transport system substrate-binding protein